MLKNRIGLPPHIEMLCDGFDQAFQRRKISIMRTQAACQLPDPLDRFIINSFDENLRAINIKTDRFDFNWPIYRLSIIEDFRFLGNMCNPAHSMKILDIGVGIGLTSFILRNLGFDVSSCDIKGEKRNMRVPFNQAAIFRAQFMRDIDFRYSEPDKLPFDDLSFDIILLYAVIEHVEEVFLPSLVAEIDRVLKYGGRVFIFKCPQKYSYSEFIARKLLHSGHKYLWTIGRLRKLFTQVNFALEEYKVSDFFPMTTIKREYPFHAVLAKGLSFIERIFLWTPLRILFHNIKCVFVKRISKKDKHVEQLRWRI